MHLNTGPGTNSCPRSRPGPRARPGSGCCWSPPYRRLRKWDKTRETPKHRSTRQIKTVTPPRGPGSLFRLLKRGNDSPPKAKPAARSEIAHTPTSRHRERHRRTGPRHRSFCLPVRGPTRSGITPARRPPPRGLLSVCERRALQRICGQHKNKQRKQGKGTMCK